MKGYGKKGNFKSFTNQIVQWEERTLLSDLCSSALFKCLIHSHVSFLTVTCTLLTSELTFPLQLYSLCLPATHVSWSLGHFKLTQPQLPDFFKWLLLQNFHCLGEVLRRHPRLLHGSPGVTRVTLQRPRPRRFTHHSDSQSGCSALILSIVVSANVKNGKHFAALFKAL